MFLIADEIRMNSNLFHWPQRIKSVFELASTRFAALQEAAEDALRNKISALHNRISSSTDFVKSIQRRDGLSRDEIERALATLDEFQSVMNEFNKEADAIAM